MSQLYKNALSSIPPQVATSYLLDDGNSAVPSGNVLKVLGGAGTFTTLGASNQIEVNVVTDGFVWSEQIGVFFAQGENGYFCNNALSAFLPNAPALGTTIIIYADTAGAVAIFAQGTDRIQVGFNISIPGGGAQSTAQGSILELVYKPSDATWHSISSFGTWSVV